MAIGAVQANSACGRAFDQQDQQKKDMIRLIISSMMVMAVEADILKQRQWYEENKDKPLL